MGDWSRDENGPCWIRDFYDINIDNECEIGLIARSAQDIIDNEGDPDPERPHGDWTIALLGGSDLLGPFPVPEGEDPRAWADKQIGNRLEMLVGPGPWKTHRYRAVVEVDFEVHSRLSRKECAELTLESFDFHIEHHSMQVRNWILHEDEIKELWPEHVLAKAKAPVAAFEEEEPAQSEPGRLLTDPEFAQAERERAIRDGRAMRRKD